GEIHGFGILVRDASRFASQHIELADHLVLHDPKFRLAHHLPEAPTLAREFRVCGGKGVLTIRINQETQYAIGKLVTGSAFDRPILTEAFVMGEDLLDYNVALPSQCILPRPQTLEILFRIEQSVDMVDA